MTKTCRICNEIKEFAEFHNKAMGKFGLDSGCKVCRSKQRQCISEEKREKERIQKAEYRAKNRDTINAKNREYEKLNAEKIALRKIKYRDKNKEKIAAQKKIYHASTRAHKNVWYKNKKKTNPNFRLKCLLRGRIANFLNGIGEKRGSAIKDLGCTIDELRLYLESKFQPGMTWENHSRTGWHIDHIIPLSSFDLTDREQFLKACHYTNLQPLWAIDNFKKNRYYK